MNIPDAKDARRSFENGENSKAQEEEKRVADIINRAIRSGQCSVSLRSSLLPSVQKKLALKGYKYTDFYDQREGETIVTISW